MSEDVGSLLVFLSQDPNEICDEIGLCNTTHKAKALVNALNVLQPQPKQLLIPMMPGPVIFSPPEKNSKAPEVSFLIPLLFPCKNFVLQGRIQGGE
jgi:hypothetical protein